MREKTLDHIRQRLLEERQARVDDLVEFDDRLKDRLERGSDELARYDQHMADHGTDTMEDEKEFLLASQEGRQLVMIDEALRRLYREPDDFGRCDRCGREIAEERLDLVPWTRHCAKCKAELEASGEESAA